MVGAEGSKILVTTRSENVASIVLAGEFSSYKLQSLGDDICLSIFEQRAFGPPSCKAIKPPTLVEIGKELVRKCGGLPLAAEALGSLMRSKKEVSEWEVIRDSEIWESNPENPNKILPALKLSYDHLSPQVKQCFSYCSLFPKDSNIHRETLIRLWVAEGFIQPSKGRLLEEIGYEYFQILLWNSFFQGVNTNEDGEITSCKMHDLIHDLAQSVAGTHECSIMKASEMRDISEFRRLNLLNVNEESSAATLGSKSKLRALFIKNGFIKDIAANYVRRLFNSHMKLRVLDLSYTDIEELPPSTADLKHLRYLDLSNCRRLTKLPESITRLYNLQTLNLNGCENLKKFPKDLNKLINLRHLCYHHQSMNNDWQDQTVGQLTCLQTLNGFGGIRGSHVGGIGQLQCLNLLRGILTITGLEKVKGGGENANLKAKKFIKQLNLHWRWGDEDGDGDEDGLVLEGLEPHPNLRTLKIFDFMCSKFPTWMSSNPSSCLQNLVHLRFYGCNRCKQLPLLGVFPSLRFLEILSMSLLEEWLELDQPSSSSSTTPSSSSSSYPLLESIQILECPRLKSMPTKIFSLKEFVVRKSTKSCNRMPIKSSKMRSNMNTLTKPVARDVSVLRSLVSRRCPDFQGLNREGEGDREFDVQKSGMGVSSIVRSNLNTLTKLVIWEVDGLEFLPLGLLKDNNVLQSLEIRRCPDFQGFNRGVVVVVEGDEDLLLLSSSSSSLRELDLHHCPVLRLLPGDLRDLTSLRSLSIIHCGESNDDHCKNIEMSDCPMLKSMPTLFPSLEALHLVSCDGKIVTSVLRSNLMDTLTQLWLSNIPGLMFLPLGLLKDNNVLQTLYISYCPDFQGFIQEVELEGDDEDLSLISNNSLRELYSRNCPVLRLLPDLKDFTSLLYVTIEGCNEQLVISLPNGAVLEHLKSSRVVVRI